ncbi:uncharacterized protein Bfra_008328 [Botrytis fragariae]|uniref:Uncharacterized protein n=1 Tax=Botrytis fragariae TaxID=1964551 RepID=A0A8H6AT02_9HELO|nr:uncharacterized protein Bfra_008328 [Botrytis fragariae]KAF5873051.1 hypothetical protein Bfra_008328 [Botrytis fragariae]
MPKHSHNSQFITSICFPPFSYFIHLAQSWFPMSSTGVKSPRIQCQYHTFSKCTISFLMAYSHSISDTVTSALFQHVDSGGYEDLRFFRYPRAK